MIDLIWDESFKRKYKKLIKNNSVLKEKFWQKLALFCESPFDSSLKTHKLSGNLKDIWAIRIDFDLRLLFIFKSDSEVLLIDIGSHDEVY
jgi:addiction module RelE/StbE family toxin